jgi:hypothetical protein
MATQRGKRQADEKLLLALACGATVENAARAAGISPATAYRRLAEPVFRQRLQQVRTDMVSRAAATLTAAGTEAVKTLVVLQQSTAPAAVRLGAARAVLEMGIKLREMADLEERLAALEQQIAVITAGG